MDETLGEDWLVAGRERIFNRYNFSSLCELFTMCQYLPVDFALNQNDKFLLLATYSLVPVAQSCSAIHNCALIVRKITPVREYTWNRYLLPSDDCRESHKRKGCCGLESRALFCLAKQKENERTYVVLGRFLLV